MDDHRGLWRRSARHTIGLVVPARRLVLSVVSALIALVLLPATGSGSAPSAPPRIPGLPPIPGLHLPKPDQKAVLRRSSDVKPTESLRNVIFGELKGTVTDQGYNAATVRLIRQPG